MDRERAVVRRGQDQDLERQCQAAFQNVARAARRPACAETGPPNFPVRQPCEPNAIAARGVALYGVRVGLPASARIGPVAQWLEPTAHNGLVGGSNPPGPTSNINGL